MKPRLERAEAEAREETEADTEAEARSSDERNAERDEQWKPNAGARSELMTFVTSLITTLKIKI